MTTHYDAPDYCPECMDGQEADKGRCHQCDGEGVVCPIDGDWVHLHPVPDRDEVWVCTKCIWKG